MSLKKPSRVLSVPTVQMDWLNDLPAQGLSAAQTLQWLQLWTEQGLLRHIDSALAAQLLRLDGQASPALLVAVAFIVYDRAMATDPVPAVDHSRSATVFASFQDSLNKTVPEDAPGWIVERYEELTGTCGAPAQPVDPAVPPAPGAAPATDPAAPAEPAAPAN
jgi:hypothetical protein